MDYTIYYSVKRCHMRPVMETIRRTDDDGNPWDYQGRPQWIDVPREYSWIEACDFAHNWIARAYLPGDYIEVRKGTTVVLRLIRGEDSTNPDRRVFDLTVSPPVLGRPANVDDRQAIHSWINPMHTPAVLTAPKSGHVHTTEALASPA